MTRQTSNARQVPSGRNSSNGAAGYLTTVIGRSFLPGNLAGRSIAIKCAAYSTFAKQDLPENRALGDMNDRYAIER
jgi:hypothetical protein